MAADASLLGLPAELKGAILEYVSGYYGASGHLKEG